MDEIWKEVHYELAADSLVTKKPKKNPNSIHLCTVAHTFAID